MRVLDLRNFIIARHDIWVARNAGMAKPWTTDSILRDYRFCNVYRELDTVTQWVSDNWRQPYAKSQDMWFAMAVARWVNWPDTLAAIGYPVPWNPDRFLSVIRTLQGKGEKVWTGAYLIGTQGNPMAKEEFVAQRILQPLWDNREAIRPRAGDTLEAFAGRIMKLRGQGTFMVGQIVADVKYADPHLKEAGDWWTWAVMGPGSRRGLNRVMGRPLTQNWNDANFRSILNDLRDRVNDQLPGHMPKLHAQDLQNCLCEFDKYERVRTGQGRPRSRYPGR